ncbi:hypothetical protein ABZ639_25655 [Saccharomonospora sp. NPDC006951]
MNHIAMARKAWSHLGKADADFDGAPETAGVDGRVLANLYDAMKEDIVLEFSCPPDTPIYGAPFVGKPAVIDLWSRQEPDGMIQDADLESPPEFYENGDRVVMLFRECYTLPKSGVRVRNQATVVVMDFEDELINHMTIITNFSPVTDAYGPAAASASQAG